MRKDKKKIEELEEALSEAAYKISSLKIINRDNEDTIKQLRSELADKDAKYAALLERYISMMEKATKLNEQTVENTPDIQVALILGDIRALITEWFYKNAYDYELDNGIRTLEKRYLEGEKK